MDSSLRDDALQLAELDRRLIRALVEANTEEFGATLGEYLALRRSLKARLLDQAVVAISDADAAKVIEKIGSGDGLPSDKVVQRISARTGESIDIHDFTDQEIADLGSDLFYSWFSHHEYIQGLAELRPLIPRAAVAESVSRLIRQAKDCYAFQQYYAAYALCRMVIEASMYDICVRRGLFPDLGDNVAHFDKSPRELRKKVSSGLLKQRLDRLYGDLSDVIHTGKSASKEEARAAFDDTLQVVEQLYEQNRL